MLHPETMQVLAKPVLNGVTATLLSSYFTPGNLYEHHIPLGVSVAVAQLGTSYVSKYIPNSAAKTLETRALEIGSTVAIYFGIKMATNQFTYASAPQILGVIVASDIISDYVDSTIFNKGVY